MPSKFKRSYKRYYRKSYVKRLNRIKLDCAITIRFDDTNNTSDFVRFVEKTSAPVRFISIQDMINGPLSSSFSKLAAMWSYYKFYAISAVVTGDCTNANGGNGGVSVVSSISNSIFMSFLPSFNPGTSSNPNNPTRAIIVEQPGCKVLNPFGVTKLFYRTSAYGDWVSTNAAYYGAAGLAICPNNASITAVPFLSCRVTLYLQVKDRKL